MPFQVSRHCSPLYPGFWNFTEPYTYSDTINNENEHERDLIGSRILCLQFTLEILYSYSRVGGDTPTPLLDLL